MILTMGRAATKLPSDILELLDVSWTPGEGGLPAFLGELLRCCERWFEASGASIFLRDGESQLFTIAARAGSDAAIPVGATIHGGRGSAGASIQSREALLVHDPRDPSLPATTTPNKPDG